MLFYTILAAFLVQITSPTFGIFLSPPFIFQTSTRRPGNNSVGSFTSNISFGAITNTSNVVVAVSQNMGRAAFGPGDNSLAGRRVNTSVFMFKDGNWTSFRLRKKRSLFDLGSTITQQVFDGVSKYFNKTTGNITSDWIESILNTSNSIPSSASRSLRKSDLDTFPSSFGDFLQQFQSAFFLVPSTSDRLDRLNWSILKGVAAGRNNVKMLLGRIFHFTSSFTHQVFMAILGNFQQRFDENDDTCLAETYPAVKENIENSMDTMDECLARYLREGVEAIGENTATSIRELPMNIRDKFQSCLDDFPSLELRQICLSKIPLLLVRFVATDASYRDYVQQMCQIHNSAADSQREMLGCGIEGIAAALGAVQDWQSQYDTCTTTTTADPTTESSNQI